ncbi:MAG: hypothetical protein GY855_06900, partial [candidate division Zixibacteria bacterium]|nr:hypothetical protein [candidate division Zixibacteria bacterium]
CVVYTPYSTLRKIRSFQPYEEYEGKNFDFLKPLYLSENKTKHDNQDQILHAIPVEDNNQDQMTHAIPGKIDYQEELEKQMRKVTYDYIKRYYFDTHPYGVQGYMKYYVWVEKGCPDMDINIQTVDDYNWSPISSFRINDEAHKGKTVILPDAKLSRKSHTPGGVAFGINGGAYNNVNKLSGKVVTKLIDSYMKRSGADILLKIEKNKDPYIIFLSNEKEMTEEEIQDEEFRVALNKYENGNVKLVQFKAKKKRWWFTWWLGSGN